MFEKYDLTNENFTLLVHKVKNLERKYNYSLVTGLVGYISIILSIWFK